MTGGRPGRTRWTTPHACLVLLAALLVAGSGLAGTVIDRDLAWIVTTADRVADGEVASVTVEEGEDGLPWTRVAIEVRRDLRGGDATGADADPGEVDGTWTLSFLGGTGPSGLTLVVDDLPRPEPGDRVLVAASESEGRISPVVGVWQGWFTLSADGWADAAGRTLSLGPDGVVRGDRPGDVGEVVDALARGEIADAPESEPNDRAPDEPNGEEPAQDQDRAHAGDDVADEAEEPADVEAPPPREATRSDDLPVVRARADGAVASALEAAAEAWREAGAPVRFVADDEADDRVTVGSVDAFGPDALSFTMRRSDAPGVDVRLRPGSDGRRPDLLMRELAWLAGVPDATVGLRSGRLAADVRTAPDRDDVAAWASAGPETDGDLTGDGSVSFYDLVRLAEAYGRSGTRLPEDLDRSGEVDATDLERLRDLYEFDPPSREPPPDRRSEGGD